MSFQGKSRNIGDIEEYLKNTNPNLIYKELMENVDQHNTSNVIMDMIGFPEMKFFLKNWQLPSMSLPELGSSSQFPRRRGMNDSFVYKLPSDLVDVGDVSLTLFCDEKMVLLEKFMNLLIQQSQRIFEYLLTCNLYFFNNTHKECFFIYTLKDCWLNNIDPPSGDYSTSPEDLIFNISLTTNEFIFARNPGGY